MVIQGCMQRLAFFTFLSLVTFLQNCDNNITLSKPAVMYNPHIHLTAISLSDKIPTEVKTLLEHENMLAKNATKFPLAYYLIQQEDIKVLYSPYFSPAIVDQLYLEISGTKYYKLFVHPDADKTYAFLQHAYRYIGPDDTEFYASSLSTQKTMVVWSRHNNAKTPFVVRMNLDGKGLNIENARVPADILSSGLDSAQMIFYRKLKEMKEPIEGQQVTRVPQFSR
jgi:hypothetical protein